MDIPKTFRNKVSWTFSTQIIIFFLAITTNILLARLLGPENLGTFTFVILLSTFFVRFSTLGIETANVYHLSSKTENLDDIKANTLIFFLVIGILGYLILFIVESTGLFQLFTEIESRWIKWVYPLFLLLLFEELHLTIFLGLQKINKYNLLRLVKTILLFLTITSLFVFQEQELHKIFLWFILANVIYFIILVAAVKPKIRMLDINLIKRSLGYGTQAYVANTAQFLNYRLDMFFVLYFLTTTDLGYYAVAVVIGEKLWLIATSSSIVLFPEIASNKGKMDLTSRVSRINFSLTLLAAIIIALIGKPAINLLYSNEYLPAYIALFWLLPGIVANAVSKVLAADLSGRGKPKYSMMTSISTLVVNVILNILLIPIWGIAGAAIASSISYIISLGLFIRFFCLETNIPAHQLLLLRMNDFKSKENKG